MLFLLVQKNERQNNSSVAELLVNRNKQNSPLNSSRGVPIVAKNRVIRLKAIANYIKSSDADIVGLQEIWIRDDYVLLCEQVQPEFPYYYYFRRCGRNIALFQLALLRKQLNPKIFYFK